MKVSFLLPTLFLILITVSCSSAVPPLSEENFQSANWKLSNSLLQLNNMAVLSNGEVWAIGQDGTIIHDQVRIAHLSEVLNFQGERKGGYLSAIEFLSEDDGWITGFQGQLRHWDGETWSYALRGGTGSPSLSDLGFTDSNNGWTVGCYMDISNNAESVAVLMKWDGKSWKNIALSENIKRGSCFKNIQVKSSDSLWISSTNYREQRPVILASDEDGWREIPLGPKTKTVIAISAFGTEDLWALHESSIAHWNGVQWHSVELPKDIWFWSGENEFATPDILALSNNNVWIGGRQLFHWDGDELEDLNYNEEHGWIVDIEADADGNVWALTFTGSILRLSDK